MYEYIENKAVIVKDDVCWIGYLDQRTGIHCNPYLIKDGDQIMIIDGGSRPDFSTVMLRVLQSGVKPGEITHLLYHHYDPDLCGSIPDFENIIDRENLKIISKAENFMFIDHYNTNSEKIEIGNIYNEFEFDSGRKLKFIETPYAHSQGSFITYDEKTKILFTSDLFGSYNDNGELYLDLEQSAYDCKDNCDYCNNLECKIKKIVEFHKRIMTSKKALNMALNRIEKLDVEIIASQHGNIINNKDYIKIIINKLKMLNRVGIDGFMEEKSNEV